MEERQQAAMEKAMQDDMERQMQHECCWDCDGSGVFHGQQGDTTCEFCGGSGVASRATNKAVANVIWAARARTI